VELAVDMLPSVQGGPPWKYHGKHSQNSHKSPMRVALVCMIHTITSLFCKRALQKRRYSAKESYNFIDPTDRSHPIFN